MSDAAQSIRDASYSYTSEVMPHQIANVLRDYGDQKVVHARIERHPISRANSAILNIATGGKFEKTRIEKNYDAYMHAWLNLQLEDGTWISTDKVQNLSAQASKNGPPLGTGVDGMDIDVQGKTFREMVNRAVAHSGSINALASYDPVAANCQLYLNSLLGDSMTPASREFLLQDASTALNKHLSGAVSKLVKFAGAFGQDRDLNKLQRESDLNIGIGRETRPTAQPSHRPSGGSGVAKWAAVGAGAAAVTAGLLFGGANVIGDNLKSLKLLDASRALERAAAPVGTTGSLVTAAASRAPRIVRPAAGATGSLFSSAASHAQRITRPAASALSKASILADVGGMSHPLAHLPASELATLKRTGALIKPVRSAFV